MYWSHQTQDARRRFRTLNVACPGSVKAGLRSLFILKPLYCFTSLQENWAEENILSCLCELSVCVVESLSSQIVGEILPLLPTTFNI